MLSALSAIAIQPLVMLCWFLLPWALAGEAPPWLQVAAFSLYAALFAAPFVLFLGVPLSLALDHFGLLRWWPLAFAGVVSAALLVAWSIPGGDAGYSSGGNWYGKPVDFIVAGKPTLYGWLNYLQTVLVFALHGLVGATVYHWVWVRSMRPNNSFKPKPLRGSA